MSTNVMSIWLELLLTYWCVQRILRRRTNMTILPEEVSANLVRLIKAWLPPQPGCISLYKNCWANCEEQYRLLRVVKLPCGKEVPQRKIVWNTKILDSHKFCKKDGGAYLSVPGDGPDSREEYKEHVDKLLDADDLTSNRGLGHVGTWRFVARLSEVDAVMAQQHRNTENPEEDDAHNKNYKEMARRLARTHTGLSRTLCKACVPVPLLFFK